tara:strand:- start:96899 stop:98230 length:1332 start_codon:yes stop_codon:yes gene_type:complete
LEPVNIAILGLGTVGSGTLRVLQENANEISRRAGRSLKIYGVSVRDANKKRDCDLSGIPVTTDPMSLVTDPKVDIVVELMGGEHEAKSLILSAIKNKKHVVTANKALIAEHGNEIFFQAEEQGVTVAFEGAVAGGIPIIKTIREGLGGNRIDSLAGIINGTGNYILSQMTDLGWDFETALQSAQEKGYAEADPSFDIDGVDAAHKLTILASIAFGIPLQYSSIMQEGISSLEQMDIQYANQLGYEIKHLGIAKRLTSGIELRVHPTLVAKQSLLAQVKGVMNAVAIHANAVGPTLYCGAGAGGEATASSVLADLVDVVRNMNVSKEVRVPYLAFQSHTLSDMSILLSAEIQSHYYIRLMAVDEPGILAQVTQSLGKRKISIQKIIQNEPAEQTALVENSATTKVPVVIMTHLTQEGIIDEAIEEMQEYPGIHSRIVKLRIESF